MNGQSLRDVLNSFASAGQLLGDLAGRFLENRSQKVKIICRNLLAVLRFCRKPPPSGAKFPLFFIRRLLLRLAPTSVNWMVSHVTRRDTGKVDGRCSNHRMKVAVMTPSGV